MPESTLYTMLEEVLDSLYNMNRDLRVQGKRKPNDIVKFMYNHFLGVSGLKTTAIKYLNSIGRGLVTLVSKEKKFGS